jgi:homopolymeric O-antigen transport system ATP-binding protein
MRPAIQVQNLGKEYRLSGGRRGYRTLRESLTDAVRRPFRRPIQERFWAIRDVGFEVQPGELVGIIGRNGAGKSTLLKILSRITRPTAGRVELNGRVGSLLEVGTGFHPELTGRENIYLNGSILGMTRREIDRKFDQIVAFAEVERFLDTPVKRYSSGMYVRLAFAVAAHLEPEILIVDEVLAVGDAAFQRKCLGRMKAIGKEGRTVLFVSHNMPTVLNLCERAILLHAGRIERDGPPDDVVRTYTKGFSAANGGRVDLADSPLRPPGAPAIIRGVTLRNAAGDVTDCFGCGEPIEIVIDVNGNLERPQVGIGFDDHNGQRVFSVTTFLSRDVVPPVRGTASVVCRIAELAVLPGDYTLCVSIGTREHTLMDALENAVALQVVPADFYGNGATPLSNLGPMLVRSSWACRPGGLP